MLEKFTTAMGYLEFYDSADVLCLDRNYIPPQLSDISFTSDLSGPIDVRRSEKAGEMTKSPLFRGLV